MHYVIETMYDVSSELEVAFDLNNILISRIMFFYSFENLDLEFKLLVKLIAYFQYL